MMPTIDRHRIMMKMKQLNQSMRVYTKTYRANTITYTMNTVFCKTNTVACGASMTALRRSIRIHYHTYAMNGVTLKIAQDAAYAAIPHLLFSTTKIQTSSFA